MALRQILLVEDDANDVDLFKLAVRSTEHRSSIAVARDGEDALDFLFCRGSYAERPSVHPSVVILDVKMPRMGGLEVLSAIRATPMLRFVPVVMLTSSQQPEDIYRSYAGGCNAYVIKPVDFARYERAVQALVAFWAIANEPPPEPLALNAT
jgi:CheY-like chemotaxis protein